MISKKINIVIILLLMAVGYSSCSLPYFGRNIANKSVPESYNGSKDTINTAAKIWKDFYNIPYLSNLIDSALIKNQELNIMLQEINISRNEIRARKGQYLPFVGLGAGIGADKVGRYTSRGATENSTQIVTGRKSPEFIPNYIFGLNTSWEVDIWRKLRNAKKSAVIKYLSSNEGKNFMVTRLIAEIANSYYELLALDNQLEALRNNIEIQQNALAIVKLQKQAARVTELAVRRFEAEVFKNQSRQFSIIQEIIETENRINFLVGRFPQPVLRNSAIFNSIVSDTIHAGIPSQLLANRPDIRQAEYRLSAAQLDVKAAKAEFYPSLTIVAGIGFQAFNPNYLLKSPESLLYSLGGQLVAPLINRNAIKANYYSASSRQIQAIYDYERTILRAHIEVANQLSNISNLEKNYNLKVRQVEALNQSIEISNGLFRSARADYMEVLLTQRDAVEAKFELIETKKQQLHALVDIYQALGGGWK